MGDTLTNQMNTGVDQPGQVDNPTPPVNQPPASMDNKDTPPVKTFTQEDIDRAIQADRTKHGRDVKSLETLKAQLEAQRKEIEEWRKQKEEAELEAIKNDPAKLSAYQMKKEAQELKAQIEKERQEFEAEKARWESEKAELTTYKISKIVNEVAAQYKGDAGILQAYVSDLGITEPEKIKALATRLWAGKKDKPPTAPNRVFSGSTNGGAPEDQKLRARYPTMFNK